jgi:hypothetical protein
VKSILYFARNESYRKKRIGYNHLGCEKRARNTQLHGVVIHTGEWAQVFWLYKSVYLQYLGVLALYKGYLQYPGVLAVCQGLPTISRCSGPVPGFTYNIQVFWPCARVYLQYPGVLALYQGLPTISWCFGRVPGFTYNILVFWPCTTFTYNIQVLWPCTRVYLQYLGVLALYQGLPTILRCFGHVLGFTYNIQVFWPRLEPPQTNRRRRICSQAFLPICHTLKCPPLLLHIYKINTDIINIIIIITDIIHIIITDIINIILTDTSWILYDWLIIYCFTSHSRICHLYGDVTISGEGLQNLGLCSALGAFEQGGIFIVPHLLWHGTSVFPVSSERLPHLVASYDTRGDVEDLF